jgi:protein-S-isoprenylcysteine O-methyltransferase Ste14
MLSPVSVATWALVVMVLYLVLVIGVRVAIAVRTTGRTGLVSPRGAPRIERLGNLVLMLGLLTGAVNVVLGALDVLEPWAEMDDAAVHVAGFALCAIGIAGTFAAQMAMGDSWRVGIDRQSPTQLVTAGMFGYTRNPGYSFMFIAGLGFAALVPTWLALAATILLVAGIAIQVRLIEEPYLRGAHGDAYAAYAGRVGRFVPGVGRLR